MRELPSEEMDRAAAEYRGQKYIVLRQLVTPEEASSLAVGTPARGGGAHLLF